MIPRAIIITNNLNKLNIVVVICMYFLFDVYLELIMSKLSLIVSEKFF